VSLKDKLEIGLKPGAPYRKDNLPEFQQDDPECEDAAAPADTPEARQARDHCDTNKPDPDELPDKSKDGQAPVSDTRPKRRRT
jgi:hypothetical protein